MPRKKVRDPFKRKQARKKAKGDNRGRRDLTCRHRLREIQRNQNARDEGKRQWT